MERTFCIIKLDAVARNLQGEILAMIQGAGLRVVAMKQIRMTRQPAGRRLLCRAQGTAFLCQPDGIHELRPCGLRHP